MKPVLVLILSKQGALQNGLLALLTTIPQINAVLVAQDVDSGRRMLQDHRPGLLLLDMDLPQYAAQSMLNQLNSHSSSSKWIALVDSVYQGQQAKSLGADEVLLQGFSSTTLITVIENLVGQQDT